VRNGVPELRRALVARGDNWMIPQEPHRKVPVHVVDLVGHGEPEVLVDLYSGGAHCCTVARLYHWTGRRYAPSPLYNFWDLGYRLRRLGRGRAIGLLGGLSTEWGGLTVPADSGFPLQVWADRAGRLRNVTRRQRTLLRRDARHWRAEQRALHRQRLVTVGMLGAYVADVERLGEHAQADAAIAAAVADGELSASAVVRFHRGVARLVRRLDAPSPPRW
jgi:hypothetical protein